MAKTEVFRVRLNSTEKALLELGATQADVTASEYIRMLIARDLLARTR